MRKYTLTTMAALLAAGPMPAMAQEGPLDPQPQVEPPQAAPEPSAAMTPDQKATYDSWMAEQRADYDLWPRDVQNYYWSLPEPRQSIFWKLNTNDRMALVAMSEGDREAAWTVVEQQVHDMEAPPEKEEPMDDSGGM